MREKGIPDWHKLKFPSLIKHGQSVTHTGVGQNNWNATIFSTLFKYSLYLNIIFIY